MFRSLLVSAAALVLVPAVVPNTAEAQPKNPLFEVWKKDFPGAAAKLQSAYPNFDRAEREAQSLRKKGYISWVNTVNVAPAPDRPFQVWVRYNRYEQAHLAGAYRTRNEAEREAQILRGYNYGSWVRAV